jgi:hypothetical protein
MSTHSVSALKDPESALGLLQECLVLSFRFSAARGILTFVSDYPKKTAESVREFAAFVFHDVGEFNREFGNLEQLRVFQQAYESRDDSGAIVVQAIRSEDVPNGRKRVEFWFGPNFGGISFEYAWVEGFTRASSVEETKGAFLYRDLRTREEFDFFAPFPSLLESDDA